MGCLLLVDDEPSDLRTAADAARELGIEEVVAKSSVFGARTHLEKVLAGEIPRPDYIILDLDLGVESGFEILRLWHSTPELSSIAMIVWSVVDEQKELCNLFRISRFVSKWEGPVAIREALKHVVSSRIAG